MAACVGSDEQPREEAAGAASLPPDLESAAPRVALQTSLGRIVLELDRDKAPQTVENFLYHVENHFYDGLTFHRVMPGFMIQAGGFTPEMMQRQSPRPPIRNEANNGLKNFRGALAMARLPSPHTATSQFFINLVDNAQLDFTAETPQGWGYAVFGRVIEGMEVVDAIAAVPTGSRAGHNDVPLDPITIERAEILSK
ncbi:MAG: peptidyl-prolyl cis-trans isomerase [Gemmatimonadota bacterium]|nr:MAG: peptidyl-prolyl cis-trans isomerase [Gemmatimonadota bacterium]